MSNQQKVELIDILLTRGYPKREILWWLDKDVEVISRFLNINLAEQSITQLTMTIQ